MHDVNSFDKLFNVIPNTILIEKINSGVLLFVNLVEKKERAYNLRQSGKTYREIRLELKCSYPTARDLVEGHKIRMRWLKTGNMFIREILNQDAIHPSTASKILLCLKKEFKGIDNIDPNKLANLGPHKILGIGNIGPKFLKYIANALESVKSIKSAREWLTVVEKATID